MKRLRASFASPAWRSIASRSVSDSPWLPDLAK
jgi:hypothetical protein